MASFDSLLVSVEFRDGVCENCPIYGRKYTVTHSDDSGEIFVTIGCDYAKDKFGPMRDEVLLAIKECGTGTILQGCVLLDLPGGQLSVEKRNEIFIREMNVALQAVRYADRCLYENCHSLDECSIWIEFVSENCVYHKNRYFGKMKEYRQQNLR